MAKDRIDVGGMFSKMIQAGEQPEKKTALKNKTDRAAARTDEKKIPLTIYLPESQAKKLRLQSVEKEKGKDQSQITSRALEIALSMDGEIFQKLFAAAAMEGTSVGEIVDRALKESW